MADQSELDAKYFLDGDRYNCPFCNRHSVVYSIHDSFEFYWTETKKAYGYIVLCQGCGHTSLHLSFFPLDDTKFTFSFEMRNKEGQLVRHNPDSDKLDSYFFYHQPTSFFTLDSRIPKIIRELVAEADGCRQMNFLVGASGALRKSIYKFLKEEKANEEKDDNGKILSYENQIKRLKAKYARVPDELFDALSNIQDMISEELHEEKDWEPWTREEFDFFIAAVKVLLHEIYVVPEERKMLLQKVLDLGPGKKLIK